MSEIELVEQVAVAMNPVGQLADGVGDAAMKLAALARVDEVAALLVRLKHGQQRSRASLSRAVFLLARAERSAARFKRGKYRSFKQQFRDPRVATVDAPMADIVERFVAAALSEWIDDVCDHCQGRGLIHLGKREREDGEGARLTRVCPACNGSKRRRHTSAERAKAMGIDRGLFEAHWQERFDRLLRWLYALDAATEWQIAAKLGTKVVASSR
ncbi:DnaJ-like cysteine-rich domain-containing protein [Chitinasiproducens palmae]|uniref:Antitermination protein n=1 Tax=Chitinasiproducens palmae TaxID=1770053 RepID=A0A1H2PPM9_9BURK|nr:hypothetical protein [Chitinasiproducens palmae]SDV48693.1 hypothetical protein SAMN05216551_105305 [Chitinasiproducens palmae]